MNTLYEILGPSINPNKDSLQKPTQTIQFDWDCGGWNNIVLHVEIMICLAKMYERALVIPKANKWYLLDGDTHLFDFYDQETFESFIPTSNKPQPGTSWKPVNKLISDKGKMDLDQLNIHQNFDNWYFSSTSRILSHFSIALPSPESFYQIISSGLRIKTELIDSAVNLLKHHELNLGEFIALHVRRNDFQYKRVVNLPNQSIVDHVLSHSKKKLPILIISDAFDVDLIDKFESKGHRVVCWSQKQGEGKRVPAGSGVFFETISKESVVIDMICASAAKMFFGSPLSSFSSRICHWRGLLSRNEKSIDDSIYFTMPWKPNTIYWSYVDTKYWQNNPNSSNNFFKTTLKKLAKLI